MRFAITILLLAFIFGFSCKKYPENTLWFKSPKRLSFICGKITSYKVNGIDSLQFLDSYYSPGISKISEGNIDCYATCNSCKGMHDFAYATELNIGFRTIYNGTCEYGNRYKTVKIYSKPDTSYYKKNIFVESGLDWDIIYLSKKDNKRKMKTTLSNGNTYEIQFN